MRIRRNTQLLIEPPAVATGDIAFNLLIFFLVCASSQPDAGRRQELPRSEPDKKEQQVKHIEVYVTRTTLSVGEEGNLKDTNIDDFRDRLRQLLMTRGKRPDDRVVVIRSAKDTPYLRWVKVTTLIEEAGGVITLQLQEEREVIVP